MRAELVNSYPRRASSFVAVCAAGIFWGYLIYNEAELKALKNKGGGAGKDKKKK